MGFAGLECADRYAEDAKGAQKTQKNTRNGFGFGFGFGFGSAWLGLAWLGLAWLGLAWVWVWVRLALGASTLHSLTPVIPAQAGIHSRL